MTLLALSVSDFGFGTEEISCAVVAGDLAAVGRSTLVSSVVLGAVCCAVADCTLLCERLR